MSILLKDKLGRLLRAAGQPHSRHAQAGSSTRLYGVRRIAGRMAWAAFFLIMLGMFAANVLHVVQDTRFEWIVRQTMPLVTRFVDYGAFVHYLVILRALAVSVFLLIALAIAWRRSDDWMGLYCSATLIMMSFIFGVRGNIDEWRYPRFLLDLFPAIRALLPVIVIVSFILLFHLFPDGRVRPRWTGWLAVPAIAFTAFFWSGLARQMPAWGVLAEHGWGIWILSMMVSMAGGVFGQIYRYRRITDPVQRQQTKLVLFGLGLQPVWMVGLWPWWLGIFDDPAVEALFSVHLGTLFPTLIPLAIGASILRYRLWDIDLLINRTLVYGALTGIVTGFYVLLVGGLGAALHSLSAQGNLLVAVLITGLVAVLARPLHTRLQRGVNRLMYGERDDPVAVLTRLGKQLEEAARAEDILPGLVETVARALKLPYAAIALWEGDAFQVVAAHGQPPDEVITLPLAFQGQVIGRLIVAPRAPGEGFSPADRRLLDNLAREAGAAAHAVRLTADLRRSRERLVAAQEEERRRLRRDLHDDLGPRLASLALKTDAVRNLLRHDPEAAERLLLETKAQAQAAITAVRRLAHDLRPPALDQLGLVGALREHAASHGAPGGPCVSVEAPELLPPLPAAVEVAAYRIALEALTNVARHAQARTCIVRLTLDGALQIEIADDGLSLPLEFRAGVGLTSMRERAAELGGTCAVQRRPEGGTRVLARLPLPDRELPGQKERDDHGTDPRPDRR